MIYIKNNQNSQSINVTALDKNIGLVGENLAKSRIFCIPKMFHNLNLTNPDYSFVLQVQPVNTEKESYLDILIPLSENDVRNLPAYQTLYLKEEIIENSIFLKWNVQKFDLIEAGKLKTNIKILSKETGEIGKAYISEFFIAKDVDSIVCDLEPECIFTQVLNETNKQVKEFMLLYNKLINYVILDIYSVLSKIRNNIDKIDNNIKVLTSLLESKEPEEPEEP